MNKFSQLWQAIVDDLQTNSNELGINGSERAAMGQVSSIIPPAAVVWLNPGKALIQSQNGTISLSTDIHIFCIAAPTTSEADAVDGALTIASAIIQHLTNKELAGSIIIQPDEEPLIEIVERSSTQAIAAVLLQTEIIL